MIRQRWDIDCCFLPILAISQLLGPLRRPQLAGYQGFGVAFLHFPTMGAKRGLQVAGKLLFLFRKICSLVMAACFLFRRQFFAAPRP
jgi:hypothetical protein